MRRIVLLLAATLIPAAMALLFGLIPAALRTGRLDPLDWLLPGTIAIILVSTLLTQRARSAAPTVDGEALADRVDGRLWPGVWSRFRSCYCS